MSGEFAVEKDADGIEVPVKVKSPKAEAFCALGALQRVNTKFQRRAESFLGLAAANMDKEKGEPLQEVSAENREDEITSYNDGNFHEDVLDMFDRAIKFAKFWERTGQKPKIA